MSKAPNQIDPTGLRYQSEGRRGTLTGNCSFGPHISCTLDLQSWSHKRKYERLFFTDEAVALAAGYRPCGTCSKPELKAFKAAWVTCNGPGTASVGAIDKVLDAERGATWTSRVEDVPDGVIFRGPGISSFMHWGDDLHQWSMDGWKHMGPRRRAGTDVEVVTPRSIASAINAGYTPRVSIG